MAPGPRTARPGNAAATGTATGGESAIMSVSAPPPLPRDLMTVSGSIEPSRAARSAAALAAAGIAGVMLVGATLYGCTRGTEHSARDAQAELRRTAAEVPRTPIEVAPGVVVTSARFGVLETGEDGAERFVPTSEIPAVDGTTFGWVLEIRTNREAVRWQEYLRLPKAPADWGDAAEDPDVLISKDGTSVAAQGEDPVADGELQRFYWTLAPGDPAGDYELDVAVEGRAVAHFRFRVPVPVQEAPLLVRSQGTTPWT